MALCEQQPIEALWINDHSQYTSETTVSIGLQSITSLNFGKRIRPNNICAARPSTVDWRLDHD